MGLLGNRLVRRVQRDVINMCHMQCGQHLWWWCCAAGSVYLQCGLLFRIHIHERVHGHDGQLCCVRCWVQLSGRGGSAGCVHLFEVLFEPGNRGGGLHNECTAVHDSRMRHRFHVCRRVSAAGCVQIRVQLCRRHCVYMRRGLRIVVDQLDALQFHHGHVHGMHLWF